MGQHAAWKELVRRSFRQSYKFPIQAQHSWFPGHMHKGLGQIQRRMADVDCVIEVHDARIPLSGRNLNFSRNLKDIGRNLKDFSQNSGFGRIALEIGKKSGCDF